MGIPLQRVGGGHKRPQQLRLSGEFKPLPRPNQQGIAPRERALQPLSLPGHQGKEQEAIGRCLYNLPSTKLVALEHKSFTRQQDFLLVCRQRGGAWLLRGIPSG